MEAGGKDCEEETLQMAFKKLRVDAESLPSTASVTEALAPRAASRTCQDAGGAKPKLGCTKDNWHGCMRKSSRVVSRTQRRRRSKSPILHPPKFTYSPPLVTPSGCLMQQRLAVAEPAEPRPTVDGRLASADVPAQKELPSSGHISQLVFGSRPGFEAVVSSRDGPAGATPTQLDRGGSGEAPSCEERDPDGGARDATESRAPGASGPAETADFRALSELGSAEAPGVPCCCGWRQSSDAQTESGQGAGDRCRCRSCGEGWAGVEVYSFTGLRSAISECEGSLEGPEETTRTNGGASLSGSPRSCSEQARAYVDDITIEDLSGYMEYYLYIPKKMSHMAEMMYT